MRKNLIIRLGAFFILVGAFIVQINAQSPEEFEREIPKKIFSIKFPNTRVQSRVVPVQIVGEDLIGVPSIQLDTYLNKPDDFNFDPTSRLPEWAQKQMHKSRRIQANRLKSFMAPVGRTFDLDLGEGEGERQIWLTIEENGIKYSRQFNIVVDRTPPEIEITEPIDNVVNQPVIQIKGYAVEEIVRLDGEIANSNGTRTIEGFITKRNMEPGAVEPSEFQFQFFDVYLTEGENNLSLVFTDIAGNETSVDLQYILDYSRDQTPPEIELHWPKDGEEINNTDFIVRGRLNDPSAKVEITGAGDEPIRGVVGRNGLFWIKNVPLLESPQTVYLSATDLSGNRTQKEITVSKSNIRITIDEIEQEPGTGLPTVTKIDEHGSIDHQNLPTFTVTGTINMGNHTIWVNGIKAQMKGSQWIARKVKVNEEGGTAVFDATAIPNWSNNGNGKLNTIKRPTLLDSGNPKL